MKYIQLIILMTIVIVSPAIVARASLSLSGGVKSVKNNTVQTKFGLSGKITHFNPTKSIFALYTLANPATTGTFLLHSFSKSTGITILDISAS